jgi:hypothetical protein
MTLPLEDLISFISFRFVYSFDTYIIVHSLIYNIYWAFRDIFTYKMKNLKNI